MEAAAPEELRRIFTLLDYLGVAIFAITGALVAARARQDFITCAFAIRAGAICRGWKLPIHPG